MTDYDLASSIIAAAERGLKAMIEKWAYQIWENEGRPSGRDLAHWLRAQKAFTAPANVSQQPPDSLSVANRSGSRFAAFAGAMCGSDYRFNGRTHSMQSIR